MSAAPAPKIELHVHLEGAVRPRALLEIAARNLAREYEVAALLGCSPAAAFRAGISGALCDEGTRSRLQAIAGCTTWPDPASPAGHG